MNISNKTLGLLLVAAIVISLGGTFISLNRIGEMRSLTGMATANDTVETGTANVTLQGGASITLQITNVNFGTGQVNGTASAGHDFCTLKSNVTASMGGNTFTPVGGTKSSECIGFNDDVLSFVVENTGNTVFTNVTMNSSLGDAGFKSQFPSSTANGTYTYVQVAESTACSGNPSGNMTANTNTNVCSNFQVGGANDAFAIQLEITLPEDAPAGTFTDTVTFVGNV